MLLGLLFEILSMKTDLLLNEAAKIPFRRKPVFQKKCENN
jgi:hypothetical protein